MKYVKLIVKPGTWYTAGTEAYHYDCDENDKFRLTLDEWNRWLKESEGSLVGGVLVRGYRISEGESEAVPVGEQYFDGEFCAIDEFEIEIVNERV